MSGTHDSCFAALARVADCTLIDWNGLPPGCRLADLETFCQPVAAPALDLALGDKREPATARRYHCATGRSLRAWSRDGGLVQLDIDGPLPLDPTPLGEPEARLTARIGFATYAGGEWVFARRGLAVGVSPDPGVVLYAAVFVPTSVDSYRERIRIDRAQRPAPQ